MKDFASRYGAQVSFVSGILIGWLGWSGIFRSWFQSWGWEAESVRYVANFAVPLVMGFFALLLFLVVCKKQSDRYLALGGDTDRLLAH